MRAGREAQEHIKKCVDIVRSFSKDKEYSDDGDQVTLKGVYSQEANQEAEKLLMSKSHILNIYGQNMRRTTNEGVQTLYMLTKFE